MAPPKKPRKVPGRKFSPQRSGRKGVVVGKRDEEIAVKKQLVQFVKEEYKAKRPLEIRLLKMKPSVVFKRGTMLPNLLIKSLQLTAYVIYLDYGEEIRFYFYTLQGTSLGASTLEKTPKMLSELHGKAITIYKLPKIAAHEGFDAQSEALTTEFQNLLKRYGRLWARKIKSPPVISVITNPLAFGSARLGLAQEKAIYHLKKAVLQEECLQPVLLREIFCILLDLSPNDEGAQLLATAWALEESEPRQSEVYLKLFSQLTEPQPLYIKFTQWIQKFWGPKCLTPPADDPKGRSDTLGQRSLIAIVQPLLKELSEIGYDLTYPVVDMLLFFLMAEGSAIFSKWAELTAEGSKPTKIPQDQSPFLLTHFTRMMFDRWATLAQYSPELGQNHDLWQVWLWYFLSFGNLAAHHHGPADWTGMHSFSADQISLTSVSNPRVNANVLLDLWKRHQFMEAWEFLGNIQPMIGKSGQKAKEEWEAMEGYLFRSAIAQFQLRAIRYEGPSLVDLTKDASANVQIHFTNSSDLIFYDAAYRLEYPETRGLHAKIVERPHSSVFDTQITFQIELYREKDFDCVDLKLWGEFRHPFRPEERVTLLIMQLPAYGTAEGDWIKQKNK